MKEFILIVFVACTIGTCSTYYARKADRAVNEWALKQYGRQF